jgi:GntR family transcriptional regulator
MAAALDRSSPLPLWAQLETELKRRLDDGEFTDRFPTDHELVAEYAVSRQTVREAIRHLNHAGILIRERGRGTVVNRDVVEQPLGALYSLFESIESTGRVQRSDVRRIGEIHDPVVAALLELPADSGLFYLERLRWVDDEPLAIDRVWLPLDQVRPLLTADFGRTALYDELERLVGMRPQVGWERIAPVVPPPEERRALQMRRGEAAFFIERSSSVNGSPIEWRTTTLRGANYRFVANFRAGQAPALAAKAVS